MERNDRESSLLRLPAELRIVIYEYALVEGIYDIVRGGFSPTKRATVKPIPPGMISPTNEMDVDFTELH